LISEIKPKLKSSLFGKFEIKLQKFHVKAQTEINICFGNFEIQLQKFHFKAQTETNICLVPWRSNCKSSISRLKLKPTFVWYLGDQIAKVPFQGSN